MSASTPLHAIELHGRPQLAEKAVEAAAPGRERSSWFKRRDDWNRNVRLRQEAADRSKAAIEAAMVAQTARASAASAAADAGARRSAVPRAHPVRCSVLI